MYTRDVEAKFIKKTETAKRNSRAIEIETAAVVDERARRKGWKGAWGEALVHQN